MEQGSNTAQFARNVLIAAAVVISSLLLLVALYYAFDVLLLVFAATLLAIFLRGLAEILAGYLKLSDGWLVLIVSVVLIVIVAGSIALLSPSIAEQMVLLREKLPASAQKISDFFGQYQWGRTLLQNVPSYDSILESLSPGNVLSGVSGFFTSTIGIIGNVAIALLLSIYLAIEPKLYLEGFISLFPKQQRSRVKEVIHGVYQTLRWWLIGKAGSMLFIGVLTWIGLSIIGVPLALTLGLLAGLLSFIPNFGPIISAVPAILLAFVDSPITAVYVMALFIGVQLVESNIVTPFIERETVELPPALTITFQLALAVLVGGLGIVLATPMLAGIVVVVQMLYIEDVLGDKTTAPTLEGTDPDEYATDSLAEEAEKDS